MRVYVFNFNKRKRIFVRILFLCLIFFLCFVITTKIFFPIKYFDSIKKYSAKYNLDPSFVCAIIYTESKFNSNSISHKNAIGLMQIKTTTADWIAKKIEFKNYDAKKLFDPDTNINFGCFYFKYLLVKFDNNYDFAFCAYNAGLGNLSKWIEKYSHDKKKLFYIPFKETKNYLARVKFYQKIYALRLKFLIVK